MWITLLNASADLVCSNYVIVETTALVQNRVGIEAVRTLQEEMLPVVRTEWIDEPMQQPGVTALLTAGQRHLSLEDCVSFGLMRRLGIRRALAIDAHLSEQGFEIFP
jgi:predicted nucleic acid-binding protein